MKFTCQTFSEHALQHTAYKTLQGCRQYLAVAVHISLPDHLVHLLVSELLPQVSHHMPQLRGVQGLVFQALRAPRGVCQDPSAATAHPQQCMQLCLVTAYWT